LRQLGDNWKPILTTAAAIGVGVGLTVLTVGTGAGPALLLASTILSATASSATSGVLGSALNGGSFGDCFLAGVKGAISGGATAMATGGTSIVGDFFGHNVGSVGTELLRAGSHATLSGLMYTAQGGNFEEGFAVGAVSSLVGSGLQAAGVGPVLGILSSGAVGAGTAALMGGDPVKGFFQGAAIGALNHWAIQSNGQLGWEGPEVTVWGHRTRLGHTMAYWNMPSGAINQVNVEFDVILSARLIYNAASAAVSEAGYSEDMVSQAQEIYPNKAGKIQLHHIDPKYMGGAPDGPLVPLDGAYHQVITNEFRTLYPYGQGILTDIERQTIMNKVYSKFPLPSGYGF